MTFSRAIATFHHPRYEVAPFGSVNDGALAVRDLLAGMFARFPDFHVDVLRVHQVVGSSVRFRCDRK